MIEAERHKDFLWILNLNKKQHCLQRQALNDCCDSFEIKNYMGNQLCPGSAKDLIQELGDIQKGEKSYEIIFKSCFDFREHRLHELLVNQSDDSPVMHLELLQEQARPHFLYRDPSVSSLPQHKAAQLNLQPQMPSEITIADLIFQDGSRYKGKVKQGMPHGQGQQFNSDGGHYKGTFNLGKKEGQGIYRFANTDQYQGEFRQDAMWGHGVYKFANGDIYEGEFKSNERCGEGNYIFNNGANGLRSFSGVYRGDVRDGNGSLKYDNEQMKGKWKNGLYEFAFDPNLIK